MARGGNHQGIQNEHALALWLDQNGVQVDVSHITGMAARKLRELGHRAGSGGQV